MRSPEDDEADSGLVDTGSGEKAMGFLDHLEELRVTLFKCVIAFILAAILVGVFFTEVKDFLDWPLHRGQTASQNPATLKLITNTMMGSFSVFISIGFLAAVTLTMPFILLFFGQFVAPALTAKEKRLLTPGCVAALLLFLAGGAFAFFLLMPSVIEVAINANFYLKTEFLLPLDSYYSNVTWMVLGLGATFQFPMIIQILVFLDLLSVSTLRKWRRLAFLVCLVAAALITPTPDAISMLICTAPLYFLYEAAIIVAVTYTAKLGARSREVETSS